MNVEPYTIDTEDEARTYLADLLKHPDYQSQQVIEARCAKLVKDPAIRAFFLAEGATMLAEMKG
ncbi:hypothetical protein JRF84_34170 [Methylobacterium organophilum]|uniref:hypothetical protein n=1 Tax=Methylobacterium TaxID=407 RepID=UPI0019D1EAF6|nr:hypothetical protein [Methylobacterium organophilum]MBN6824611.1 hypothetical protein [Methylobacterium organophilum]